MNKEYITISDINRIIKFTIESNSVLKNVYIKGEIKYPSARFNAIVYALLDAYTFPIRFTFLK